MSEIGDTYTCGHCHGEFERAWNDAEAMAEAKGFFGQSITLDECVIICDDCFQLMHPENHPHLVETAVKETLERRAADDNVAINGKDFPASQDMGPERI